MVLLPAPLVPVDEPVEPRLVDLELVDPMGVVAEDPAPDAVDAEVAGAAKKYQINYCV